jgi:hypothetical protein
MFQNRDRQGADKLSCGVLAVDTWSVRLLYARGSVLVAMVQAIPIAVPTPVTTVTSLFTSRLFSTRR